MTSSMQGQSMTGANGAPVQGEQLQQAASGLIDQAARTADAQASTTMTKVGDTLDTVVRAIQDAAGGLRENQPQLAGFADTAASQLEEAATYLRDHTASDALQNVQELARRQPALIVGGGLALGLVLGRFLRTGASVAQSDRSATTRYGGQGTYGAGSYGTADYDTAGYGTTGAAYGATAYGATAGTASDIDAELAATDAAAIDAESRLDPDVELTGDITESSGSVSQNRGAR